MVTSFIYTSSALLLCFYLFLGIVLFIGLGYYFHARTKTDAEGIGTVEGALFALLGLILAFTFGMAGSRYDTKRLVITEEANAISTAFLRVDLYPNDSVKMVFQNHFKEYINARIANYEAGPNLADYFLTKQRCDSISSLIWNEAINLSKKQENYIATMQIIPALNAMIDVVTTRESALKARVPDPIVWLLFFMIIECSFFIGYSIPITKKVNLLSIAGFVVLTLMVVYIILDLDRPSRGFINLNEQVQVIKDLQKMFPK